MTIIRPGDPRVDQAMAAADEYLDTFIALMRQSLPHGRDVAVASCAESMRNALDPLTASVIAAVALARLADRATGAGGRQRGWCDERWSVCDQR